MKFYEVFVMGESEGMYKTLEDAKNSIRERLLDYGYKTKKERLEIASRFCILEVTRIIDGTDFITE